MYPTCLCFILHIRNKFPIPLCLKTHNTNDCGFSPILSTYLFKSIVATSVIEQLTQRQIDFIFDVKLLPQVFNPSPLLFTSKCRFSLLFSFTVSITLLYVSHWPQLRVCHYKVFQLSIQYAHWRFNIGIPPSPRNNTK